MGAHVITWGMLMPVGLCQDRGAAQRGSHLSGGIRSADAQEAWAASLLEGERSGVHPRCPGVGFRHARVRSGEVFCLAPGELLDMSRREFLPAFLHSWPSSEGLAQ